MSNTRLVGMDIHSTHDARTVLIKIPFMIKKLLEWMFLCSPDMELLIKQIRNQSFSTPLSLGKTKRTGIVTLWPKLQFPKFRNCCDHRKLLQIVIFPLRNKAQFLKIQEKENIGATRRKSSAIPKQGFFFLIKRAQYCSLSFQTLFNGALKITNTVHQ